MKLNTTNVITLNISDEDKDTFKLNEVENNILFSKLLKECRTKAKNNNCYVCKKTCNSFCNSHSIPAFCLKNITKEGKLNHFSTFIENPVIKPQKGLNNSGTFNLICRECDSTIFKDYENPLNYIELPNYKMIAQIAMKNFLKNISKRYLEIELYNVAKDLSPNNMFSDAKQNISNIDLNMFKNGYNRSKRIIKNELSKEYYLFFYEKLDYVVPIAIQEAVVIFTDFTDSIINNIFNEDPSYELNHIHLCVFPMEESSVIMMFIDSNNKRYRKFYRDFNKLNLEDKLSVVNFIIFRYCEDFFISPKLNADIIHMDSELMNIISESFDFLSSSPIFNISEIISSFSLSNRHKITNLLKREYSIK